MRTNRKAAVSGANHRQFTVVSLFTGGGGLDIGLENTGRFSVKVCVELVPAFCEALRRNRDAGRTKDRKLIVYQADIGKLTPEGVLADLGLKPGDVDLVIGGPPCQTFSTTGKRGTVQDPRGTLLWQFLHFIDGIKPKMFAMENVRGLMSAALRHRPIAERPRDGGSALEPDEEPGSVIRLFVSDLHNEYRMDCFEVNAVNYGVPQLRERVIFIGNRFNRLVEFPEPTHGESDIPSAQADLFPTSSTPLKPFHTLGDALAGLRDPTNNKENQILAKLQDFGFKEEDRAKMPGVLSNATGEVRVYRCIGQDFWSSIGSPNKPAAAASVFLEVLLALSKALAKAMQKNEEAKDQPTLEDRVNEKLQELAEAVSALQFPRASLPEWIRKDFVDHELFWLATAMTAFFDRGV